MNPDAEYSESFRIDGVTFDIDYEPLGYDSISLVEEAATEGHVGRAKLFLIYGAVKHLTRDGEVIIREKTRHEKRSGVAASDGKKIPGDYDPVTGDLFGDRVVRTIVAHVPWLTIKEPFASMFADYAKKDAPKKDPTPIRDAAQTGS